jgi:N-ethylmaleimide reductase
MDNLFTPLELGDIPLRNRIVMAPMTRSRATAEDDLVTDMHVEYYRQRASAGLIITEGVQPSKNGKGYCRTPGIYNAEQVAAWRRVTDAVHAEGGSIVCQIMHVGRVASHLNKHADAETVAPSAIKADGEIFTEQGMKPLDSPRALLLEEIPGIIEEYRKAAHNAIEAGFDGVELHCTSGYLPAQFLSTGTNHRQDKYGGSLENRCRFPLEVLAAMADAVGASRVGFRICPGHPFNDLHDDHPEQTFRAFLAAAAEFDLAYLHVIRMPATGLDNIAISQDYFADRLLINESYSVEEASQALANGDGQAVTFGRPFIANPDFVRRIKESLPLAKMNPKTLYVEGSEGFIDYPFAD